MNKCSCGKIIWKTSKCCRKCAAFKRKRHGWNESQKLKRRDKGNPNWKGDDVGLNSLHRWAKARLIKPKFCENCRINEIHDLANISGEYKRDLNDWKWLCRRCHMIEDGRMKNLKQFKNGECEYDKV